MSELTDKINLPSVCLITACYCFDPGTQITTNDKVPDQQKPHHKKPIAVPAACVAGNARCAATGKLPYTPRVYKVSTLKTPLVPNTAYRHNQVLHSDWRRACQHSLNGPDNVLPPQ